MQIADYTKKELREILSWYDVELPSSASKKDLVQRLEVILSSQPVIEEGQSEIQMSVRVKRIKEQNYG